MEQCSQVLFVDRSGSCYGASRAEQEASMANDGLSGGLERHKGKSSIVKQTAREATASKESERSRIGKGRETRKLPRNGTAERRNTTLARIENN